MIYAHIGRWGSSYEPASAIFQLEHAVDTALKLSREPHAAFERVTLEPQLVDSLASGYERIQQPEKAFEKRVVVAEMYLAAGDTAYAREVLEPIKGSALPDGVTADDEERYNRLRNQILGHGR
jgi:hypothetical protein